MRLSGINPVPYWPRCWLAQFVYRRQHAHDKTWRDVERLCLCTGIFPKEKVAPTHSEPDSEFQYLFIMVA